MKTICKLTVLLLATMATAMAQVATGTPAFNSFGGGPFDVVNLGNLNVRFTIPILHKAGRAGNDFAYDLKYDSSIWSRVTSNGATVWQASSSWGWAGPTDIVTGHVTSTIKGSTCNSDDPHNPHPVYYTNNGYKYTDTFGTIHTFNGITLLTGPGVAACGLDPGTTTASADDMSGWTLTMNLDGTIQSLTSRAGSVLVPPLNWGWGAGVSTDRNGNQIVANSSGQFFDTTSSSVPVMTVTGSGTATSPVIFTYYLPSGSTVSTTVTYKSYTVATNFGISGTIEYGATAVPLVDRVTLPDGSQYAFTYEATPSSPSAGACTPKSGTYAANCVTARLASVSVPTGGTIAYVYSGGSNGIQSDGSTAGLTRTLNPGGTWTYTRSAGTGNNWTTTVTDPTSAANQTVINFSKDAAASNSTNGFFEQQRITYQGSAAGGTVLSKTQTCYNAAFSGCAAASVNSPITQTDLYTLLGSKQSLVQNLYDSTGRLKEVDRWDFGVPLGAAPSYYPTVSTTIAYASLGNHILDKISQVQVSDGTGAVQSTVQYSYDGSTVTATTGTPNHTAVTGSRGNLTQSVSFKSQTASTPALYHTYTYNDTGTLASSSQPTTSVPPSSLSLTSYTYGTGSCGNAFPVLTSTPASSTVTLPSSTAWNCYSSVATSSTDPNGAVSAVTYADPYFPRPTLLTDPFSNGTVLSYPSVTVAESSLVFNSGGSVVDARQTVDGFGRPVLLQGLQGPGLTQYDTTETDYDVVGRVQRTTLPFSAAGGGTSSSAPGTTFTYDAVGRPVLSSNSVGGTVAYTYVQNDVLQTVGPAPAGENAKSKQLEYDGLGRLTSVCEITTGNARTASGSCGQANTLNGYGTTYTYDALSNIVGVLQNSQTGGTAQTRTFTYDWLSRLTKEVNPESGTTSYVYDSLSGDVSCGTVNYPGQLVKKTDALSNVSCYSYDVLGRLTGITYPSGQYAASTPTKYYVYDVSSVNGTALSNTMGRLAEAYTCSGSPCTKKADTYFSYSARGEITDVYESTLHSGGTYHVAGTYFPHGALNRLALNITGVPTIYYGGNADASGLDGEGRYTKVTASGGTNPAPTIQYSSSSTTNVLGALSMVKFGSNDYDSFALDPSTGRPAQYQFNVGSAVQTVTGALTWNANGTMQQLQVTDQLTTTNSQTCTFSYDDLGRLGSTGTTNNVSCTGGAWAQSINFDSLGNIWKSGTSNFAASYSTATNRMTTIGSLTPSYDGNGNLTNDTFYSYAWDAEGKMVSAGSGAGTASVTYDALGRQVEKKVGSVYTQTLYGLDGSKLALMNGQTLQKAFIAIPGGGTALYTNAGGATPAYYRHPDWLGSARLTTYGTQSATAYSDAQYAPFGEAYPAPPTAPAPPPDQSFTGQNPDTVAQLDDFMFREYSPTQGRWMSPDPAGLAAVNPANPQSWNRYAYVVGNPLELVDPLGLDDCLDGSTADLCVDGGSGPPVDLLDVMYAPGGALGGGGGTPGSSNKPFSPCSTVSAGQLDYQADKGRQHIEDLHMSFVNTGVLPLANRKSQYSFDPPGSRDQNFALVAAINAYTFDNGTVSQSRTNRNFVFVAVLPPQPLFPMVPASGPRPAIGLEASQVFSLPLYFPTNVNTLVTSSDCKTVQTSHPGYPTGQGQ